jgi:pimeloyl-ACP methyl ester carboxylesterase
LCSGATSSPSLTDLDGFSLTERVEQWRQRGERVAAMGRAIHVFRRAGEDPLLLLLHGFPSSSYECRALLAAERRRAVLAFDFLGFGLSEKPRDHTYSLFWQADLVVELLARFAGDRRVFLVAHDMGTSVATELMARELEGEQTALVGALLFNGSILLERARPTVGQKLLRSPAGPLAARLTSERFFRRQFASLFSPAQPLSAEEAADQWALLANEGGHRIPHKLIHYMDERERHTDRWHGTFASWPKPLELAWGMLDPVAVPAVLEGLRELRPQAPVTQLPEVGHYPQIEVPAELAVLISAAVQRAD